MLKTLCTAAIASCFIVITQLATRSGLDLVLQTTIVLFAIDLPLLANAWLMLFEVNRPESRNRETVWWLALGGLVFLSGLLCLLWSFSGAAVVGFVVSLIFANAWPMWVGIRKKRANKRN